jgi:predicted nucleic acid-binding protein
MRVVLDTNVLISAFIARKSVPAQVVHLLRTEELFLLQSQEESVAEFGEEGTVTGVC